MFEETNRNKNPNIYELIYNFSILVYIHSTKNKRAVWIVNEYKEKFSSVKFLNWGLSVSVKFLGHLQFSKLKRESQWRTFRGTVIFYKPTRYQSLRSTPRKQGWKTWCLSSWGTQTRQISATCQGVLNASYLLSHPFSQVACMVFKFYSYFPSGILRLWNVRLLSKETE